MSLSTSLDKLHLQARENRWLWYFAIFCRVALAAGFIPSGMMKIMGERFTVLAVNHPMGNFLEAIYHTGFYYTIVVVFSGFIADSAYGNPWCGYLLPDHFKYLYPVAFRPF